MACFLSCLLPCPPPAILSLPLYFFSLRFLFIIFCNSLFIIPPHPFILSTLFVCLFFPLFLCCRPYCVHSLCFAVFFHPFLFSRRFSFFFIYTKTLFYALSKHPLPVYTTSEYTPSHFRFICLWLGNFHLFTFPSYGNIFYVFTFNLRPLFSRTQQVVQQGFSVFSG